MGAPPARLWVGVMIFFATFFCYAVRVNMSISILSMAKSKPVETNPECGFKQEVKNASDETDDDKFLWDSTIQGNILGAYFVGYLIGCIPAGILSEWFGPWAVVFLSILLSAIFNSLTAIFASVHWSIVLTTRGLIGLLGGFIYPALQTLIARWAPPQEKGKFLGAMMGNTIGTVVTWNIIPLCTDLGGWPWGFHVISILLIVFLIPWWFLVSNSPDDHKRMSQDERDYIKECQQGKVSTAKCVAPYGKILLSIRVWALIIAQFGNLWLLYMNLTILPKYMSQVLGFNLKQSAGLSALPYIFRFFIGFAFGATGDFLMKKQIIPTIVVRKVAVLFSHIIPAILLVSVIFVGCQWELVVTFLILQQIGNGAVTVGHLVNNQDIAPNFAATIYSAHSFIGGTTGYIVPAINGYLTKDNNGLKEWATLYWISSGVLIGTALFFIIFGTVEVQSWNEKKEDQ